MFEQQPKGVNEEGKWTDRETEGGSEVGTWLAMCVGIFGANQAVCVVRIHSLRRPCPPGRPQARSVALRKFSC